MKQSQRESRVPLPLLRSRQSRKRSFAMTGHLPARDDGYPYEKRGQVRSNAAWEGELSRRQQRSP